MQSVRTRGLLQLSDETERMGYDTALGTSLHKQVHPPGSPGQV
jgi:hypothetical protein